MWTDAANAPDGKVVMTKIDDNCGSRNESALYRRGNLWFVPDGSMYVYYRPTHFRPLTDAERDQERARIEKSADAMRASADRLKI